MDIIPGVFDGTNLILSNQELIPLAEINRARLELKPYLLFPVEVVGPDGEYEETRMEIIYPHTVDREFGANQLVYGERRQTRIYHYLAEDTHTVKRKPDLRHPHYVKTLGYRQLVLEKLDSNEVIVQIDGNCHHISPGVSELNSGQEVVQLVEFFDRPSEFANIIKKAGLEVYSN